MVEVDDAERAVDPALVRRWRDAETSFFGRSLADPDEYTASMRLVRGLADGLRDVASEEDLEAAYRVRDSAWCEERLAAIGFADAGWFDLGVARDAAFNLRLGALRGEILGRAMAERLAAARDAGEAWLAVDDGDVGFAGRRTYRRVDVSTKTGVALFGYSVREWGRGETFWMEVIPVDPESGARLRGAPPLREPREYVDRPALDRAFARARARYGRER